MSDWKTIRPDFRDALIRAFKWRSLVTVLLYRCDGRRLDVITSKDEGFATNVDDVIDDAVQNGWLKELAEGALAENPTHTGLKATVPDIVKGVAEKGNAYYQGGEVVAYVEKTEQFKSRDYRFVILGAVIGFGIVVIFVFVRWAIYDFGIVQYAPRCTDTPIQLEYESTSKSRRIVQGNAILIKPGSVIRIFAVPFGENINESKFTCDWEYVGDGEVKKDSCQVLITTGKDSENDSITAIVHQSRCASFTRESTFLMPAMDEGG